MFLLDTNIVSEPLKRRPHSGVRDRFIRLARSELFVSVVTVWELRFGAARLTDSQSIWSRIAAEILPRVHVLEFDTNAALAAGDLEAKLERLGRPISPEDLLIASVALTRNLTFVTRNVQHFERIEKLKIENWFE